jgi:hypothetical protein
MKSLSTTGKQDTYLYKEGNREPAFLRYPRYKDRPENRRNRLFDRDDEL